MFRPPRFLKLQGADGCCWESACDPGDGQPAGTCPWDVGPWTWAPTLGHNFFAKETMLEGRAILARYKISAAVWVFFFFFLLNLFLFFSL